MVRDRFDIVRVPFPFTDRMAIKKRPALALSTRAFNAAAGHTVFAITTRGQSAWPCDYDIVEWQQAGLKFPSWVRIKLFTPENSLVIDQLGKMQPADVAGFKNCAKKALW